VRDYLESGKSIGSLEEIEETQPRLIKLSGDNNIKRTSHFYHKRREKEERKKRKR